MRLGRAGDVRRGLGRGGGEIAGVYRKTVVAYLCFHQPLCNRGYAPTSELITSLWHHYYVILNTTHDAVVPSAPHLVL